MGKFFPFITPEQKHKYIWTNLPGKTGQMIRWCKRAKITLGKDNPVYLYSGAPMKMSSSVPRYRPQRVNCTFAQKQDLVYVCLYVSVLFDF